MTAKKTKPRESNARPRRRATAPRVPAAPASVPAHRASTARRRDTTIIRPTAVLPTAPDTPGSDPGIQGYRDTVRTLIRDGQPSYATNPYGLVRQEQLTDQLGSAATPTQTTFFVRWINVPLGKNFPYTAVPESIAAYVDFNPSPATVGNGGVISDIDYNGNFTLAVAPVSQLLVSYGWQASTDGDLDQLLDNARSWLQGFATLDVVPDGLAPALTYKAASLALRAIAAQMALPDVTAGEARESLSEVSKEKRAAADDFEARADAARLDYWTTGAQNVQPQAAIVSLGYPVYQPPR